MCHVNVATAAPQDFIFLPPLRYRIFQMRAAVARQMKFENSNIRIIDYCVVYIVKYYATVLVQNLLSAAIRRKAKFVGMHKFVKRRSPNFESSFLHAAIET